MPLYNKINLWHLLYKIHIFTHAEHLQIPQCVVPTHSRPSWPFQSLESHLGHDLLPGPPDGVTEHYILLRT